ncbi:helix-turn-helix domain-containing protein, partial [Streptomyces sp. NPDC056704]|uniref:AlbA family DNA-binding domain-containing protein n=1 Tax=Streptomyces sp. NPDC056704 TaxID=3345917 RepID=UPI0036ADB547
MARSWTRLHEFLGSPPGPVTYEMVAEAVRRKLGESDDLDWKQALPATSPVKGEWNEFAKDVAAMANTRGGLLVYGVSDAIDMVGVDLSTVDGAVTLLRGRCLTVCRGVVGPGCGPVFSPWWAG